MKVVITTRSGDQPPLSSRRRQALVRFLPFALYKYATDQDRLVESIR